MNEVLWTTEQVAEALGVSTSRVRQILISGRLPAIRHGNRYRGWWEIDPEAVKEYQKTRRGRGAPKRK